jgi:hypothetical protein
MAQRTVYDSGPLSGRGAAKHAANLVDALGRQFRKDAFTVSKIEHTEPGTRPGVAYRFVVRDPDGDVVFTSAEVGSRDELAALAETLLLEGPYPADQGFTIEEDRRRWSNGVGRRTVYRVVVARKD